MTNLYNEIESYAAEWMRNLAQEGHIAAGTIDERSILDLRPADVADATQFHAFAGLGAWSYALRLAGWPDDEKVWTGSCPCQPFSSAGRKGGFDDERHLWPAWFGLIRKCRPPVVFGEQVASPDGLAWLDLVSADLEGEGYAFGAADLCAAGVGAPHIRQRLYFVAYDNKDRRKVERSPRLHGQGQRGDDVAGCGQDGELAIAGSKGRQQVGPLVSRSGKRGSAKGMEQRSLHSGDEFMGDARRERSGRYARAVPGAQGEGQRERVAAWDLADEPIAASATLGMAIANEPDPVDGEEPGGGRLVQSQTHATTGFWGDCEWVPCRDGKHRPVEPGTFPLAHGATARVGRLRAYGNAIVPEVAATFIRAVMDVRGALTVQP